MDLYAELRGIVEALGGAGIRYALVGGLAVSAYTVARATEDIDLMMRRDDVGRAIDALRVLGFNAAGRPMRVAGGRLEIQRLVKVEETELTQLDLLLPVAPEISALLDDRATVDIDGHPTAIIGFEALKALKRLRSSPQDRVDLDRLERGS